nr:DCD (Development and Cell Death) domain-like protein isoform 1 [Ipomoea batatas]
MKMNNSVVSAFATAPATDEVEEKKASNRISGFIFLCNGRTKAECYRYRVFGLPLSKMAIVEKIKTGTKLFLFDFESKHLYGVYEATSNGRVGVEPLAFGGKFPAQVQFRIYKGCLPLHETAFKRAIKDNYKGIKFEQELDEQQVSNLLSLFRPLSASSSSPVPNLLANICSPLPNMGPPHVIHPLAMKQQVKHSIKLPFGEDPYVPKIHHGHVQNIQSSQHRWQGSMPITDRVHLASEHSGFAAPSGQYYTADSQQHVTASYYPNYTAKPNVTAPIHQYYTADAQKPNIAAPSHPYHTTDSQQQNFNISSYPYYMGGFQQLDNTTSCHPYYTADSQQLNATALSHQYYPTDPLKQTVAAPSHPSCTADSQQLNATAHIQQYFSTDSQQLNAEATSHPCYTAESQQPNAEAPSHPYYTANYHQPHVINGAAQLRQDTYFGSMQVADPQDQLMGSQYYPQLPQQMHQPSAVAYNSYSMPSAPYGSLVTQPEAPQATGHNLNAPT